MAGKLLALLSVNTNWNINVLRNLISVCPHLDYERLASMLSNSEEVTLDKLLAGPLRRAPPQKGVQGAQEPRA